MRKDHKEIALVYLSEFTTRFCVWTILSQLLIHLLKIHWAGEAGLLYIMGASLSLVYLSTLFGGLIKDYFFEEKQAVILGVALIALGNILLLSNTHVFYVALGLVFLGGGMVTPNTPLLLSSLITLTHENRTRVFTIFYGITNAAVILGPIVGGFTAEYLSWQGMLVLNELIIGLWLISITWGAWLAVLKKIKKMQYLKFFSLLVLSSMLVYSYLQFQRVSAGILAACGIVYLAFIGWVILKNPTQRRALLGAILLIGCAIAFFVGEFQVASTLVAYANGFINLQLYGVFIPAGSLLSIESVAVVLGSFLIAKTQFFTQRTSLQAKLVIGLLSGVIAFVILYMSTVVAVAHQVNLWWIVFSFLILGVGEVSLMPSIISYITEIAPAQYKGRLMAGTYFALSLSGYLSGVIGSMLLKKYNGMTASLSFYRSNFTVTIILLSVVTGLVLLQWLFASRVFRGNPQR
jgi:proton-dependent oligopeptide transporter, POT family